MDLQVHFKFRGTPPLGAPDQSAQGNHDADAGPPADITSLLLRLHGLSAQERKVAELLTLGLSTEAMAARLHVSRHTVRDHVKPIFAKFGARSRSELMALALGSHRAGLACLDQTRSHQAWIRAICLKTNDGPSDQD